MATPASQSLFLKQQITVLVVAVALIAIVIASILLSNAEATRQEKWNTLLHNAESTAAVLKSLAENRTPDNTSGFYSVARNIADMNREVRVMGKGDPATATPPMPSSTQVQIAAIDAIWDRMQQDATAAERGTASFEKIVQAIGHSGAAMAKTQEQMAGVTQGTATPEAGAGQAAAANEERIVTQQGELLKRVATASGTPANKRTSAPGRFAAELVRLAQSIRQNNTTLAASANPRLAALARSVTGDADSLGSDATQLASQGPQLDTTLRAATATYLRSAPNLAPAIGALARGMQTRNAEINQRYRLITYGAGGLALLALILLALLFISSQIRMRRQARSSDERQQQAILRLLDEITPFADGDLTGNVTVTGEFTGAIADAINYTIQTLRDLVGTINHTSTSLVTAAGRTRDTALRMSRDSERQAKDISEVTTAVSESSQHLQRVAGQAQELAEQAHASVQTAHTGAGTVNQTIQLMSALREQIQDTAKRIKRLGESSQEIGNITEVIDDIAEQTNTLALNASIQAAMAGESGRGFAVVAGEVQRLAERATAATRRIEALIKAIQADTNEAIVSMERSTSNVVSGAQSAEEAGRALGHIESSSQQLAHTITQISVAARTQSQVAAQITETMQSIREISLATAGSADQTSSEVAELNALSDRLRKSVAGFKLPQGMRSGAPQAGAEANPPPRRMDAKQDAAVFGN
ncbi:MAG TPA: methyl-accepting chemotaxis protein [Nevskiaceae bacterium]